MSAMGRVRLVRYGWLADIHSKLRLAGEWSQEQGAALPHQPYWPADCARAKCIFRGLYRLLAAVGHTDKHKALAIGVPVQARNDTRLERGWTTLEVDIRGGNKAEQRDQRERHRSREATNERSNRHRGIILAPINFATGPKAGVRLECPQWVGFGLSAMGG